MSEEIRHKIEKSLAAKKFHRHKDWRHSDYYPFYCRAPDLNLLDGVRLDDFERDFREGAGGELELDGEKPPKFCALISSSALAANCFGPFRNDPARLTVAGISEFEVLRFEARCPTGLKGTPPTLDVLLRSQDHVLAIESKFTEYLTPKPAKFSKAYDRLLETLFEPQWAKVFEELRCDPFAYAPLDAAQLVKHYLGLRNSFRDHKITLLYLYWEPANAREMGVFEAHSNAVRRLTKYTDGSEVRLEHLSYADLWQQWATGDDDILRTHAAVLRAHYWLEL